MPAIRHRITEAPLGDRTLADKTGTDGGKASDAPHLQRAPRLMLVGQPGRNGSGTYGGHHNQKR